MIHFSSRLKSKLPKFTFEFERLLIKNRIQYKFINHTKDIWCRDYMPIRVGLDEFVLFNYNPSYLKGAAYLKTNNKLVCDKEGINHTYSSIVLDGGNVVKYNQQAILTDRVFSENKTRIGDAKLLAKLEQLLQAEVIIIPTETADVIGHADGMVRFINKSTVLVNDYSTMNNALAFQKKLYKKLELNNLDLVLMPYAIDESWYPKNKYDIPPATGVYINYLQVDDTVILPQFSIKEDEIAFEILNEQFRKVIKLDCQKLAQQGGVLNCITWN